MAERVGIVGAGTMGSGIAEVCLRAGKQVRLSDVDAGALENARERILQGLDGAVARARLSARQRDTALASLELVETLAGAAQGSGIVIETAVEDLDVKQAIFRELDKVTTAETVLATNTSSLSVADCAAMTRRPQRVLGLHFFNPAPRMALVELVLTERTDVATSERAADFVETLGKTVVRCADAPGFIVNRVGRPYLLEAVRMLEAGEASVVAIDAALESAGYPMGPFRLMDLIGLDVDVAIDRTLQDAFDGAPRFEPPRLERQLAEQGRLGRKSGHGFYRYGPDGHATPRTEIRLEVLSETPLHPADIVERLELGVINEAYRAVGEGVAAAPDIDTAMRLGAGHPRGPFERVDELGLRHIVVRLRVLHEAADPGAAERFEVAPSLWQMATV